MKKTTNERLTLLEHDVMGNGAKGLKQQVEELNKKLDDNAKEDKALQKQLLDHIISMKDSMGKIRERQQYFAGKVAAASIFISVIIGLIIKYTG